MENVQVICGSLLIDDLLDLSRITRNKLELRKERVKLVFCLSRNRNLPSRELAAILSRRNIHDPATPSLHS